jgi:uncharacterized protein (TIGR03067 family)
MPLAILLTVLPILPLTAAPLRPERTAGQVSSLEGQWQLVSTTDAKHDDPGSEHSRMVVAKDGTVVFRVDEAVMNQGTLTVTRWGKMRCVDLTLKDGTIFRGTFERESKELRICFDEAGKPRPAALAPTGTQWLERWRLVEP